MADIAKCRGEGEGRTCELRDSCWRFVAPEHERQAWFVYAPFLDDEKYNDRCGFRLAVGKQGER